MPRTEFALIPAAGRGARLERAGELRPKGFLQLGERPIIEESVLSLIDAGIRQVVIVTGHQAQHYEAFAERYPGVVRLVHNPRYAESGSMQSLVAAHGQVGGDMLLLESDLIYEPRALRVLLEHAATDALLVSGPTGSGDEVYVGLRNGCLGYLAKTPPGPDVVLAGEMVGISRLSLPFFDAMVEWALAAGRSAMVEYEQGLVGVASARPVICPVIADLAWSEIDNQAHLSRARSVVYPAIVAARQASVRGADQ